MANVWVQFYRELKYVEYVFKEDYTDFSEARKLGVFSVSVIY